MSSLHQRGFTLIEMLVVVVIVGILLGITLLSPITSSIHHIVQKESTRLQMLFSQIRDKALLDNMEYGFSVDDEGQYSWWFFSLNEQKWIQLEQSPFQPWKVPTTLNLFLELSDDSKPFEIDEQYPSVVFYSDYQVTPFRLHIIPVENTEQTLYLVTDGLSDIERVRQ